MSGGHLLLRERTGRWLRQLGLALVVVSAVGADVAHAQLNSQEPTTEERVERALEIWQQGLDARASGELPKAFTLLEETFRLAPRYDVAISLAELARLLKKAPDAARYLSYAISTLPLSQHAAAGRLSAQLREVRSLVSELKLVSNVKRREVLLDGKPLTTEPFIAPGKHRVHVSSPGHRPVVFTVSVKPGELLKREVILEPLDPSDTGAVKNEKNRVNWTDQGDRRPWLLWAGGGLGATIGLTALWIDHGVRSDIDSSPAEGSSTRCYEPTEDDAGYCAKAAKRADSAEARAALASGLAVASGLVLVGSALTYWFWKEPPPVRIEGSTSGVGASWRGQF